MHCLTAWGQWAVELLQCTAPLPGGIGQCNFCNTLPHCLGAVGSVTPAVHCLTALGQWAAELLQTHCLTAWEQWAVQLLQCTASLPGGSGQCNSCNGWSECSAGPVGMYYWAHRPGGMGSPTQGVVGASFRAYGGPSSSENRAHRPGGDGESRPGGGRSLLPGPMGAVGSGTSAIHCPGARGQWAVDLLQCTASLPGAVGSGPPATHRLTAWGQWVVDLLQYTASLPGGSGQWTSCYTLPHCLGAVGSGPPAMHCRTAWGQWAVGSGPPAIHCPTAWG